MTATKNIKRHEEDVPQGDKKRHKKTQLIGKANYFRGFPTLWQKPD